MLKTAQYNTNLTESNSLVNNALSGILVTSYSLQEGISTFVTYRGCTVAIATYLKLSSVFTCNNPIDCCVVDCIGDKYRFTVAYTVRSFGSNITVQILTKTSDILPLVSLQSVFPAFNWAERESWDFFGTFFVAHPDLRRILTDYGFSGHPLRKDFPLSGFREVHYEDSTKHIEYSPIELSQNFRVLNFLNPWSNEKEI